MLPTSMQCEDCGQNAIVRGYGQIEYDWPETTTCGSAATTPIISRVRLTIDCPNCGEKKQEFFPGAKRPTRAALSQRPVRSTITARLRRRLL